MLLTHQSVASKKHALIAMMVLFGLSQAGFAGPRNAASPASGGLADKAIQSGDEADGEQLQDLSGVSLEERIRLRMDLKNYTRTSDPTHVQIEDRRRLMNKGIQERFFNADRNDDGLLSREEVLDSLPQVARHYMQIDLDGDGYISMSELVEFQARLMERRQAAEERIQQARDEAMRAVRAAEEARALEEAEAAATAAAAVEAAAKPQRRARPKSKQAEVESKPTL